MGFKAMANQYITRLYARIIYALHNNQGNCTSGYVCGDTLKPSPGHLRSSAGCSQVEIPSSKPRKLRTKRPQHGEDKQEGYIARRVGTPNVTTHKKCISCAFLSLLEQQKEASRIAGFW